MTKLTLNTPANPTYSVDSVGNIKGPGSFPLAQNLTIAANSSSAVIGIPASGTYSFEYVVSGTSPSLALQTLAVDAVTWFTLVTVTATGPGSQLVNIPAGSGGCALRLTNTGSNSVAVSAALVI